MGGDTQYEIKYVSDLILKNVGKDDSKVTYKDSEPYTTKIKTPDSSKAKRDLHFELKVPVEEGLRRTVRWFNEIYTK